MAKITVRDTGPGIAAEQISLIFKDFYRIGGSGGGGLGLGLGIVQRLAKLIHARITVESALGSGTSFIVEVAMGVNQPTTMPLQMPDQMPLPIVNDTFATPVRLLLVDDNEPLRHAMAQHLTALGAEVTQAQDVRHAGQVLRNLSTPIDVAVADYDLGPGKTGLELLLMLNDRIGEEVPGVIITGSEDPDVIRALDDSDFEWFQKPIDIAVLWDAIIRARASVPPRAPAVPQLPGAISARSALPP
jgi:CheY-like chemotaxis protein